MLDWFCSILLVDLSTVHVLLGAQMFEDPTSLLYALPPTCCPSPSRGAWEQKKSIYEVYQMYSCSDVVLQANTHMGGSVLALLIIVSYLGRHRMLG
jgi:hypothetical protein